MQTNFKAKFSKAKMFLLPAAVLLLAAACNNSNPSSGSGQNQNPPPAQPQAQIYKYQPANFEFQYTQDLVFTQPQYADLENKIVQLSIPKSAYPGTNFSDAGFTVSDQFTSSLNACLALQPTALELRMPFSANSAKVINGTTFYAAKGSGAAAGNLYESNVYRAWHNQDCIEVSETLHTGNIGNFPAGTVTEVDHNAVFNRLDQVLNTFKFD